MVSELLGPLTSLYVFPVREFFCLRDMLGRQPRDCLDPSQFFLPPARILCLSCLFFLMLPFSLSCRGSRHESSFVRGRKFRLKCAYQALRVGPEAFERK